MKYGSLSLKAFLMFANLVFWLWTQDWCRRLDYQGQKVQPAGLFIKTYIRRVLENILIAGLNPPEKHCWVL